MAGGAGGPENDRSVGSECDARRRFPALVECEDRGEEKRDESVEARVAEGKGRVGEEEEEIEEEYKDNE